MSGSSSVGAGRKTGPPKAHIFPVTILILITAHSAANVERETSSPETVRARILRTMTENYVTAPAPPQFVPLPPGTVKPTGWLHDWAETSANGIVGQLGERHVVFRHGWTGTPFESKGAVGAGLRWPLEQSAYWLDGLVRLAHILDRDDLKETAHARLDIVVDGVNNRGETFIWWEPKNVLQVDGENLPFDRFTRNFNNWAHAHMGRALTAYYQATGDPRILKALTKVYADYPIPDLPKDQFFPHGAATNLDPMLTTYAMSGDKRVLDNALKFARSSSFRQLIDHWATEPLPDGHTVLYYEHARLPAVTFPWTGNEQALEASRRVLQLALRRHGLPVGVASGHEHLMGTGAIRGLETCNVPAAAWTNKWMLQLTGEQSFADQIEQVVLNAGPASVSRDFDTVCYFQTMNRIDNVVPVHVIRNIEGYEYSKTAGKTLCCVANITRMIPDYIQHMWMATLDGGLAAVLYGPNRITARTADGTSVTITTETDYPFRPDITMTVSVDEPLEFPLSLRIPGWCRKPTVQVNGARVSTEPDRRGFVKISRRWAGGDKIQLLLPMKVDIHRGKTTSVPDTAYFKKPARAIPITKVPHANRPFASVHYGPITFALPIPDETPNKALPDASWQFALDVNPADAAKIEIVQSAMPDDFHWQLDAPLKLNLPARRFDWKPTNTEPLPIAPIKEGDMTTVTLVPYGCTKFRVSMFPVTE